MNSMGITGDLGLEAAVFGQALLTGVALGIYYDLYRILRRVFHFGYAMILGQDIIFWVTGAVGVFFSSVVATGGQLRIFFVMMALAGWGIYAATAGSLLMTVVDVIIRLLRRLYGAAEKRLIQPFCARIGKAVRRYRVAFGEKISRIMKKLREKREKTA